MTSIYLEIPQIEINSKQECIPVGCVLAAHLLSRGGGGGWVHPRRIFWGKEIEKKRKKNLENPPKISDTPLKISDTPPENFRNPLEISDTPQKFQTPSENFRHPPKFQTPRQFQTPPPGPDQVPPRGQTHTCKLITLAQLCCGR